VVGEGATTDTLMLAGGVPDVVAAHVGGLIAKQRPPKRAPKALFCLFECDPHDQQDHTPRDLT
jgi:hypothetical protein